MMEQDFIENELIIVTKATLDKFLKEENPADLIALYIFFYYTAKWQQTNIIKATQGYVKKGLGWGIDRLSKSEDKLIRLGLIEKITRRDKKGKMVGWFVKVKYIFTSQSVELVQNTQKPLVDEATNGKQETNALSTSSINALSTNKEIEPISNKKTLPINRGNTPHQRVDSIYRDLFKDKYGVYPNNSTIGGRLKVLKDLCKNYTELQLSLLLIHYFNWNGMTRSSDFERTKLEGKTHDIYTFKFNITQYEMQIRNIDNRSKEFDDSDSLLEIVGEYILELKNK